MASGSDFLTRLSKKIIHTQTTLAVPALGVGCPLGCPPRLATQTLWKENRFLSRRNSIAENDPGQRPHEAACRVSGPRQRWSPDTRFPSSNAVRPLPIVHSRFYNFCRLLGGAKMSRAQARKVETIFGIQKGSCRTRTQSAPKRHACLYRFGEFLIRDASGNLEACSQFGAH